MNDNEEKKYSVIQSFMKPFWFISENMKVFLIQGACFSTVVVLLSYLFGQKYLCFFNHDMAQNMYCPTIHYMYFPYLILKLLIISVFINLWYDKVFNDNIIDKQYFKSHSKKFCATFILLLIFLVLNFIPLVSYLLLYFRVPNPVWQIEQLYFTVVAIGFLVPLVLIRFYGLFARFLARNNLKDFKDVWTNS